ncbi:MAG: metal ABC transporter substrate-binding protein [Lachnospiraceae bacterium]|nr:metal ABC transporter substrate-binding protein [Lachnospiraceae bacterium]
MRVLKNKYVFTAVLLAAILFVGAGLTALYLHRQDPADASEQLTVVTSFYPMYIATENVIGDCDDVTLENLSEPQTGCLHDYQLTSEDMKLLSTADVFIINGGGIESFLSEVAEQYPDLVVINACEDLTLLEDNAHAWMSMEKYMVQVQTICDGLAEADTARRGIYAQNAENYLEEIQSLRDEYSDLTGSLDGQPVVLFHEAYEYLADDLGLEVAGLMDLDEERQVSAGEVADILSTIEERQVSVIFAEELYGKDMGDTVEQETDVQVIYLDTLTRGDYDADSYLDGMRANLEQIREAFEE